MTGAEVKLGEEKMRPLARAYHWTCQENIWDIRFGGNMLLIEGLKTNEPGLTPLKDIVYFNRKKKVTEKAGPYTFAFLDSPYPVQWKKQPDVFKALFRKFGKNPQLYMFDVYEGDNPQVVELGFAIPYFNGTGIGREFFIGEPIRDYIKSIKPLSQYKGNYILPELLLPRQISYDRLHPIDASKITASVK